ncbi:unannotated protein [freshwater metagenome]|uniref:Unannotated protein n=1 Tax=freshwater metagenome TaxID=449393 RepID=A0A6J7LSJ3_9ZZZZ
MDTIHFLIEVTMAPTLANVLGSLAGNDQGLLLPHAYLYSWDQWNGWFGN